MASFETGVSAGSDGVPVSELVGLDTSRANAARGRDNEREWVASIGEPETTPPRLQSTEQSSVSNIDSKAEAKMEAKTELDAINVRAEAIKQQVALANAQRAMIVAELRPLAKMLLDEQAENNAIQTREMVAKRNALQISLVEVDRVLNDGNESLLRIQAEQKSKQAQFNMAFPEVTQ